jgi:hypothetical protein
LYSERRTISHCYNTLSSGCLEPLAAHLWDRDTRRIALALLPKQKHISRTRTLIDVVEGLMCPIRIASRLPTFEHMLRLFLTVSFRAQLRLP